MKDVESGGEGDFLAGLHLYLHPGNLGVGGQPIGVTSDGVGRVDEEQSHPFADSHSSGYLVE